jgi:hypothetical protein
LLETFYFFRTRNQNIASTLCSFIGLSSTSRIFLLLNGEIDTNWKDLNVISFASECKVNFADESVKIRENILKQKVKIIGFNINTFLIVFDADDSESFHKLAKKMVKYFGSKAIESLIILCKSSSRKLSSEDFQKTIEESKGGIFLLNEYEKIYFCQMEDFHNKNVELKHNLKECLDVFCKKSMVLAFDMIDNSEYNN